MRALKQRGLLCLTIDQNVKRFHIPKVSIAMIVSGTVPTARLGTYLDAGLGGRSAADGVARARARQRARLVDEETAAARHVHPMQRHAPRQVCKSMHKQGLHVCSLT